MRFGTLIRSLYRAGSLKTGARELRKYKLYLVGVQVVRWEKGGTDMFFSMERVMKIIS
jgi:hypothetical protein